MTKKIHLARPRCSWRPALILLGHCWAVIAAAACGGGATPTATPREATTNRPQPPPAAVLQSAPASASASASASAAPPGHVDEATAPPVVPVDAGGAGLAPETEPTDVEPALVSLPAGTRVLHIGDSFAGALGLELGKRLNEAGLESTLKYKKATYIPTWAWNPELPQYLRRYQPDLVLITLGGNELQIPDPSKRIPTLQRLVKRLDGRPCVWIGIPLWEGAKPELMATIRANVAPCKFLDSYELVPSLARAKDGIHPSLSGRAEWADVVVNWLRLHQDPTAKGEWRWR